MLPLHFRSALDQARLLKAGKISAVELLDECLNQFAKHNDALNAVVVTDIPRAKRAARAADARYKKEEPLSPFDGVPMTAKESFDWTGTPSTWGAPEHRENLPRKDAVAIMRMLEAGAVLYGKTNVPFMLSDWQSFNEVYGTTNNPWDVSRGPGGSSGGSAVAVATGMSALDIGSDIGASIRNPAHYCGIYGHKPTYGIVPYTGHMLPGARVVSDITVAGPLARSAKDLGAMMKILVGYDGVDARGMAILLPAAPQKSLADFRVAVKLESKVSEVDDEVKNHIMALAKFLKTRVKKLSLTAAPAFNDEDCYENFITLLRATATKKLPEAEYNAAVIKAKTLDRDDKSYVAMMTRAFALSHGDWLRADERRHEMAAQWESFFGDWDVMLCPAAASAAFTHDHVGERHERFITVNGKKVSTIDQRFWAGFSGNFYLPSTVAPLGLTPKGLPTGVQIITRRFGDYTSLKFAEFIEREYAGFVPPPGY